MNFRFLRNTILPLACAIALIDCAGQAPPGGGPPDTVPPTIIWTFPDTNAVRVSTNRVEMEFSEYVERRSVEESIFISPFIDQIEYDWSGRTISLEFPGDLKENTTYVVNVGTDVKDLRANNRMASGFTLAFSTGDSVDQGVVSGRVFDQKPEGVMIFAYRLSLYSKDTLDPGVVEPDYITQTGKDGFFKLSNVAIDAYRLFAVRDTYKNLLYVKQVDAYGVPQSDVELSNTSPRVNNVRMRLGIEDTSKPFIAKVLAVDPWTVQIRFSEPVDSTSFGVSSIVVEDTLGKSAGDLRYIYRQTITPNVLVAGLEAALEPEQLYQVRVSGVRDSVGNSIDALPYVFESTADPDTLAPSLILSGLHADSLRGIPREAPLLLLFSEAVNQTSVEAALRFIDSVGGAVSHSKKWNSPATLTLTPTRKLASKAWYTISIVMDSVRDKSGNGYKDSTLTRRFQSYDSELSGTLEGGMKGITGDTTMAPIHVVAEQIGGGRTTIILQRPGMFKFEELPEGRYTLSAFSDSRRRGRYNIGKVFPFEASDYFTSYSDTVRVRARWGVDGILMDLDR